MGETITFIMENKEALIQIVLMFIGMFAAIAAVTPTKKDDSIAGKLTRLIDVLGLNVGEAKNQEPKK